MDILVEALVGQLMDEAWIAVVGEDDGLVSGKEHIILLLAQTVGVLGVSLQAHEVHNVDDADLHLREGIAQDGHSGEGFQRRRVAAAGHDDIRLLSLVCGGPLPDADALGAVLDGLLHGQPLRPRVLGGDDAVDVVARADAVVKAA